MILDKGMLSLIRSNAAAKVYGDEYSPIPCGPVILLLVAEIVRLNELQEREDNGRTRASEYVSFLQSCLRSGEKWEGNYRDFVSMSEPKVVKDDPNQLTFEGVLGIVGD